MKFRLLGLKVEAKSLSPVEEAEHSRLGNLNDEVVTQIPRLHRPGRVQYGGFGKLIDDGWTVEEIASVVDSWPTASYLSLTFIVPIAGFVRQVGGADVADVCHWLHAILELSDRGKVVPRPLVRDELGRAGVSNNPASAVKLWTDAAGSRSAGLAALAAGLRIDQITH